MIVSFLETDNHDFALVDFNLSICTDVRAIRSNIEARLRFFLGEWFIDLRQGMPYFQEIFVKNPAIPVVRSLLSRVVTTTPGVVAIVSSSFRYDPSSRTLFYFFEASTDTEMNVEIGNAFIMTEAA